MPGWQPRREILPNRCYEEERRQQNPDDNTKSRDDRRPQKIQFNIGPWRSGGRLPPGRKARYRDSVRRDNCRLSAFEASGTGIG